MRPKPNLLYCSIWLSLPSCALCSSPLSHLLRFQRVAFLFIMSWRLVEYLSALKEGIGSSSVTLFEISDYDFPCVVPYHSEKQRTYRRFPVILEVDREWEPLERTECRSMIYEREDWRKGIELLSSLNGGRSGGLMFVNWGMKSTTNERTKRKGPKLSGGSRRLGDSFIILLFTLHHK